MFILGITLSVLVHPTIWILSKNLLGFSSFSCFLCYFFSPLRIFIELFSLTSSFLFSYAMYFLQSFLALKACEKGFQRTVCFLYREPDTYLHFRACSGVVPHSAAFCENKYFIPETICYVSLVSGNCIRQFAHVHST